MTKPAMFTVVCLLAAACSDDECIDGVCPGDVENATRFAGPCRFVANESDREATFTYDGDRVSRILQTMKVRGENGTTVSREETTWTYDAAGQHASILVRAVQGSPDMPMTSRFTTTWTFDATRVTSQLEECYSPTSCQPKLITRVYDRSAFAFHSPIWSDRVEPRAYLGMIDDDGLAVTTTVDGLRRTQRTAREIATFEFDAAGHVISLVRDRDFDSIEEHDERMRYEGDLLVERPSVNNGPTWTATYDRAGNIVEERTGPAGDVTRIVYDYGCW